MAFRAVTRLSSLPWRNCLRLLETPLTFRSYITHDTESQDTATIQPEQPVLRYTWYARGKVIVSRVGLHVSSELYRGISASPFPPEVAQKLDAPLNSSDIEIKADGMCNNLGNNICRTQGVTKYHEICIYNSM